MEQLTILNENNEPIGTMERTKVHESGHWHETFHCWIVHEEDVYVQRRSAEKIDFPSLFDCTVAGHLLADEKKEDGVREIEEEIGLAVTYDELVYEGIIPDEMIRGKWQDREFAHVHTYDYALRQSDIRLQEEEVEGLYLMKRLNLARLLRGHIRESVAYRFGTGERVIVTKKDFVPHTEHYYEGVVQLLMKV